MFNLFGQLKAKTVDMYLSSIREQIIELIEPGSRVIDIGCGTGDFLFKLSSKVSYGLGIEKSAQLISYVENEKLKQNIHNIEFNKLEINAATKITGAYNYGVASLFFHVLDYKIAVNILTQLQNVSENLIICSFSQPHSRKESAQLWLDQRFTSHYKHYKKYCQMGYMEGLLKMANITKFEMLSTFDPVIKIYRIKKK